MSSETEQLIAGLSEDLAPVRRLPRLRWVAATVIGATGLGVALSVWAANQPAVKSQLHASDLLGLLGHLALASGALAIALGSCVPGRAPTERVGAWALATGALVTLLAGLALLGFDALTPEGAAAWQGSLRCTTVAMLPALVPAALLTIFAGRGVPRRPTLTLLLAALSVTGFGTLPLHLGCADDTAWHVWLGHLLAPVTGGALVFLGMRLFYRRRSPLTRR